MHWIRGDESQGLSRDESTISTGLNSGYQAICLAYYFGAERIVLLGYDMQHTGGRRHWHGNHPCGLGNASNTQSWVEQMGYLASDLRCEGVQVVNATTQTALKCFPRVALEDAL